MTTLEAIRRTLHFRGRGTSAIDKTAVAPVAIARLGLEGDAVADPSITRPEMAVHHHDHYPMWRDFPAIPSPGGGAFGEIVATG